MGSYSGKDVNKETKVVLTFLVGLLVVGIVVYGVLQVRKYFPKESHHEGKVLTSTLAAISATVTIETIISFKKTLTQTPI